MSEGKTAKVGDFVEIIANTNQHDFEIGQVVIVVDWQDFDPNDADVGVECSLIDGGEHWFVRHSDYQITAQPSTYEELKQQNAVMREAISEALEYLQLGAIEDARRWLYWVLGKVT